MNLHQSFIDSIETIRKKKNLAIHDLIEGITSERSYRRYRNQQLAIPVSTMLQLMERLEITLQDLVAHNELDDRNKRTLLKFARYINRHRYRQADTLVDRLRYISFDDPFVQRFATLQIHRYDLHLGRINQDVLHDYLKVHWSEVNGHLDHPFALAFLVDVFSLEETIDRPLVKRLYQQLANEEIQLREQELFVLSGLSFLRQVVLTDQVLLKPHMKLYRQIKRHAQFHKTLTFDAELSFQEAYLARSQGNTNQWESKLVHYVMQLVLQANKAVYERELRLLNQLCATDVHDVLARHATQHLIQPSDIKPESV